MKAKEIAKWVVDNRYNCTTISDEDMYKMVLGEITLLLNKEKDGGPNVLISVRPNAQIFLFE